MTREAVLGRAKVPDFPEKHDLTDHKWVCACIISISIFSEACSMSCERCRSLVAYNDIQWMPSDAGLNQPLKVEKTQAHQE
jgi:hypothetical protein